MAKQKTEAQTSSGYKNQRELRQDVSQLATDKGWRTIQTKGGQVIIRR